MTHETLPNGMTSLPNHEFFENLFKSRRPIDGTFEEPRAPWVCVQFSANWCAPCRRLDKATLVKHTPGIVWYYCDIDSNDTSLGYAGLKSIPGFCLIQDGTFKAHKAGASGTEDVLTWLASNGAHVTPVV